MSEDLTMLVLYGKYPAFKNNNVYTGSFTISGSTGGGVNQRTATVQLNAVPDLTDAVFNGPTDSLGSDPRPSTGWFKQGQVWVRGDNAGAGYTNYPTPWVITSKIVGSAMVITATYVQTFTPALTLTSTLAYYRLVDFSVF